MSTETITALVACITSLMTEPQLDAKPSVLDGLSVRDYLRQLQRRAVGERHHYVANTETGRRYLPKGYTAGTTYPLGDTPSREETGETDFNKRVAIDIMGGSRCFRAIPTGEKRAPRKGEWYLSGATVTAYKAAGNGMQSEYMIAKLVRVERVPAQETYRVIG